MDVPWLRDAMAATGTSSYELARLLKCHKETVRQWMNGEARPSLGTGRKLASYLAERLPKGAE